MVVKEMVGNDCRSVKISFMATFFYFSIIRQTRKKNSATLLSEIIFSECLQSRPLLGWYSAEWAGFMSLGLHPPTEGHFFPFFFSSHTFSLKKASIGFENMFEEVPIVIKNSHLISVLMWELEDKSTVSDKHELLNLSSRSDFGSCGARLRSDVQHPQLTHKTRSEHMTIWS